MFHIVWLVTEASFWHDFRRSKASGLCHRQLEIRLSSDQQKWDARYRKRALVLPTPPHFIEKSVSLLEPGVVLDIASGDGASALYLARQGFDVIAVDISAEALGRLQYFARSLGVRIRTVQLDLQAPDWIDMLNEIHPGAIHNMVVSYFKPDNQLWHQMAQRLAPGGSLLLTSYNMQQHKAHGFNASYCLQPAEYTGLTPLLSMRYSASVRYEDNFLDEYLFQRPPAQDRPAA